jgi:hypothetical protein
MGGKLKAITIALAYSISFRCTSILKTFDPITLERFFFNCFGLSRYIRDLAEKKPLAIDNAI